MSARGSRILALFILLIVAIWAGLAYIGARTGAEPIVGSGISITHSKSGEMHTYSGTVAVPACKELSTGMKSEGVDPAQLTLILSTQELPSCTAGAPSVQDFTLAYGSATAASPRLVEVLLNGTPASFKLAER